MSLSISNSSLGVQRSARQIGSDLSTGGQDSSCSQLQIVFSQTPNSWASFFIDMPICRRRRRILCPRVSMASFRFDD
jgi:hypothetical protein